MLNQALRDRTDDLYVSDGNGGGRQILVYDSDLQYQYKFSVSNQGDAEGIAFHEPSNHLFVIDGNQDIMYVKRVGGANYQVPMQVNRRRQQSLAFRWILQAIRSDSGKPMSQRLARELFDASNREGKAMNVRDQTHRMADANKAFAHFAW